MKLSNSSFYIWCIEDTKIQRCSVTNTKSELKKTFLPHSLDCTTAWSCWISCHILIACCHKFFAFFADNCLKQTVLLFWIVHSHWHFSLFFFLLTTSPIFLLPHSETECDPQSKNKCALGLVENQSREPHVEELVLINRKWKQMLQNYWIETRVYNKQVVFTRSKVSAKEERFKNVYWHCCSQ